MMQTTQNVPEASSPLLISLYDFTIISLSLALIFLSTASIFFIFHLRFKSQKTHHLQNFNTLWTVRLIRHGLDSKRGPTFAIDHISLFSQTKFGSTHTNLQNPRRSLLRVLPTRFPNHPSFPNPLIDQCDRRGVVITLIMFICFPLLTLQIISLFFTTAPFVKRIPGGLIDHTKLCSYPLLNTIVFGAFGAVYTVVLVVSCRRLVNLVINKGTRVRIRLLAATLAWSIPLQILFLTLSSFWSPGTVEYGGVMMGMFLCVAGCAVVAQGILVIKPIVDALTSADNIYYMDEESESESESAAVPVLCR